MELQEYIAGHFNQDVKFCAVSDTTITVSTFMKVACFSKEVSMNFSVLHINGQDITFSYDNGLGRNLIVKAALGIVKNTTAEYGKIVDSGPANTLTFHLGKVKQLEKALEYVEIKGLRFGNNCIILDVMLR